MRKKGIETGNLFEFAEKRLADRLSKGEINQYTMLDVINNAVKLRKYLDKHDNKLVPELNKDEKIKSHRQANRKYYIKYFK